MKAIPKVTFSHVGIYVHDLARMELFYTTMLGLLVTDRGILPGRELVFMTRDANEALEYDLKKEQHKSMPIDIDRQSRVTFGGTKK